MRISQEEIFGPVAAVIAFKDEADALRIANGTRYSLAAGVWSGDIGRVHRFARRLRPGTVGSTPTARPTSGCPGAGRATPGSAASMATWRSRTSPSRRWSGSTPVADPTIASAPAMMNGCRVEHRQRQSFCAGPTPTRPTRLCVGTGVEVLPPFAARLAVLYTGRSAAVDPECGKPAGGSAWS